MRVCARVCARRVCVKSHPFQLPGSWAERGDREQEYRPGARGEPARWVSGMEKCFNLGTAASGAAPPRPTDYELVVSEEEELLKAGPDPARAERHE